MARRCTRFVPAERDERDGRTVIVALSPVELMSSAGNTATAPCSYAPLGDRKRRVVRLARDPATAEPNHPTRAPNTPGCTRRRRTSSVGSNRRPLFGPSSKPHPLITRTAVLVLIGMQAPQHERVLIRRSQKAPLCAFSVLTAPHLASFQWDNTLVCSTGARTHRTWTTSRIFLPAERA